LFSSIAKLTIPQAEIFPERAPRASILDAYKPYILERWAAGCHNGTQLCYELKQRGYTGSDVLARLFIGGLRKQQRASFASAPEGTEDSPKAPALSLPKSRLSPTQAAFLFLRQPKKLKEPEKQLVEQMCQALPEFHTLYLLVQTFITMLANRQDQSLDTWLTQAKQNR
jgi:transposase